MHVSRVDQCYGKAVISALISQPPIAVRGQPSLLAFQHVIANDQFTGKSRYEGVHTPTNEI
jgi:hypothetical protein